MTRYLWQNFVGTEANPAEQRLEDWLNKHQPKSYKIIAVGHRHIEIMAEFKRSLTDG